MNRADLLAYLQGAYGSLLTKAGLVSGDTPGALKEPLDRVFLQLGTAYADMTVAEVTSGAEAKALAFADYAVLSKVYDAIVDKVDVQISDPNVSKNFSQMVQQVQQRLDDARNAAEAFGILGSVWAAPVDLTLDMLEPALWTS